MASDAVFKYDNNNSLFSLRQKLAIFLCFFIAACLLVSVFMFGLNENIADVEEDDPIHDDEDEWWMDEEDLEDQWQDY